jgi:Sap, sulfolipid-1-addressing protein
VLGVLAVVVPLGLGGAFSPVMLTEQTVLLAGPDGRRVAGHYATGVVLTLLLFASVLVLFGRSISLPQEPHLDATLDLLLGALLVGLALVLRSRRPHARRPERRRAAMGTGAALGFGVVSMATNITTLALVVPAAKEVAASGLGPAGRAVAVIVLVVLTSIPAWSPVAVTEVAPGPAERGLRALSDLIRRRGRLLTVACLAAFGALLALRGIVRLLGM